MMLHTQSSRRSYLKLLALLPIVAVTLAVNAEKVTDVVYTNSENPSVESLINETIVQAEAQPTETEVVKDDEDKNFVAYIPFVPCKDNETGEDAQIGYRGASQLVFKACIDGTDVEKTVDLTASGDIKSGMIYRVYVSFEE